MFDWIRKALSGSERRWRRSSHEQEFTHRNPPAQLPPRRSDQKTPDWRVVLGKPEYQVEYAQLIKELFEKFAIEDTPYDLVLESMNAIETEMNRNGGCNWKHNDYVEHLDLVREHLLADSQFNDVYRRQIGWALDEIICCGRELEEKGHSSRNIDSALDILIARVVDWCRTHRT